MKMLPAIIAVLIILTAYSESHNESAETNGNPTNTGNNTEKQDDNTGKQDADSGKNVYTVCVHTARVYLYSPSKTVFSSSIKSAETGVNC